MPSYEYECLKCGDRFEFLLLSRDEIVKCEKCGTKKIKKIPSSFGFGFKGFGSGGYAPEIPVGSAEAESGGGSCGCSSPGCSCG